LAPIFIGGDDIVPVVIIASENVVSALPQRQWIYNVSDWQYMN
jgi:hypothetical protein